MKEHGSQQFMPPEKLTPRGRKTYALSGELDMAEGNNNGPERLSQNPSRPDIVDPLGRSLFPEHRDQTPIGSSHIPEVPSISEEYARKLMKAWVNKVKAEKGGNDLSRDELEGLWTVSKMGHPPPGYNPPDHVGRGSELPRHEQARRRQPAESEMEGVIPPEVEDLQRKLQENENNYGPNYTQEQAASRRMSEAQEEQAESVYGRKIENIQQLAQELMTQEPVEMFQKGGEFELINEAGEFQEQNFVHWVRYWMMHWHNDDPDGEQDFGQKIGLKREFAPVALQAMLNNPYRYFKDKNRKTEDGKDLIYFNLVDEIKREVWLFGNSRVFDIKYRQAYGQDEELAKTIKGLYYTNTFTKTVWGKSSLYWMLNMPTAFNEDENKEANTGRALNTAYLAYYNLADREMLIDLLGKDTALLDPNKVRAKIKELAANEKIAPEDFINPAEWSGIDDPNELMKFINLFIIPGKSDRIKAVVRALIKDSLVETHDLYVKDGNGNYVIDDKTGKKKVDTVTVDFAETFANSMVRWTGAGARNDVNAVGYDAWTKWQDTDDYRLKQPDPSRGGAFGNPYTVRMLKQVGRDFMSATFTEAQDPNKIGEYTQKTPLQVMIEMDQVRNENHAEYEKAVSQLIFPENTMRSFTIDHLDRAFNIYKQIMETEEIKLDKFVSYDYVRGLTFDRGSFEKALKENFFKPMRYAYSTYSMLDYAQMVRSKETYPDPEKKGKTKTEFRTMHMAESMFGREVLHIPAFFVEPDKPPAIDSKDWADHIDWAKVNSKEGKVAIWRQVALGRIAAELYAHRDRHSTDPKYNLLHYENIIEALEQLPSDIVGDEFNMQSVKAVGRFFTKRDIDWLRDKASVERWRLYRNQVASDLGIGILQGLGEALKEAVKGISSS